MIPTAAVRQRTAAVNNRFKWQRIARRRKTANPGAFNTYTLVNIMVNSAAATGLAGPGPAGLRRLLKDLLLLVVGLALGHAHPSPPPHLLACWLASTHDAQPSPPTCLLCLQSSTTTNINGPNHLTPPGKPSNHRLPTTLTAPITSHPLR